MAGCRAPLAASQSIELAALSLNTGKAKSLGTTRIELVAQPITLIKTGAAREVAPPTQHVACSRASESCCPPPQPTPQCSAAHAVCCVGPRAASIIGMLKCDALAQGMADPTTLLDGKTAGPDASEIESAAKQKILTETVIEVSPSTYRERIIPVGSCLHCACA